MDWKSSGGIGKTVHLAVDWDHGESPPHGRLADSLVSGSGCVALRVNIRETRENGKPAASIQRRNENAGMPDSRGFRDGRDERDRKTGRDRFEIQSRRTLPSAGERRRGRKTATETGSGRPGSRPRSGSLARRERPITATLWRYLGYFDGRRGRADSVGVNYWGGEFRTGRNLAPQVGLEPTTLRLTAECSTIELLRSNCFPFHQKPYRTVNRVIMKKQRTARAAAGAGRGVNPAMQ